MAHDNMFRWPKNENEGGKINTNNSLLSRHQYLPAAQLYGSKFLQQQLSDIGK